MADLVARGIQSKSMWQNELPDGPIVLGRDEANGMWAVAWDAQISRKHAELHWHDGRLHVRRIESAKNQIFVRGVPSDDFLLDVGEQFAIGDTVFTLLNLETQSFASATPFTEMTCSAAELRKVMFDDADERIQVLASLPEVIRLSGTDEELERRVVEVLLQGIPSADAAAIVRINPETTSDDQHVEVLTSQRRDGSPLAIRPSRRLVNEAIRRRRQSVFFQWETAALSDEFTLGDETTWAICAPLPDDPQPGWGVYLSGRARQQKVARTPRIVSEDDHRKSDLKFAELAADLFGSLKQVNFLQRRVGQSAHFFSPRVIEALTRQDMDEVLKPQEVEVTVLFCDLRGSCRIAEEGQQDLHDLWDRVSEALGIMTGAIIDQDGVIGDFQGDAAMGFWGWPLRSSQGETDQVEKACRAALNIRRRFAQVARQKGHPLANFACGVGIANGTAIAGKLGTVDQFKVSVYGPVVNLASRLESMTKQFRVPILLNDRAAERIRAVKEADWARCRRVVTLQPYGMTNFVAIHELVPRTGDPNELTEGKIRDYEAALDAFVSGKWNVTSDLLRRLPNDGPSDFLRGVMTSHNNTPPENWNGTIAMSSK